MYRIGEEEIQEVAKVIRSRNLFRMNSEQPGHLAEADRFEREWANVIGTDYALFMSGGGTGALICGLVGLGIGPGDEVLVPGYTFMATALAVVAVGAIPVIVEVDDTLTIDIEDAERKIGPNTRAIMPVHILGLPSDMDGIMSLARRHGLKVIEDACQADGGSYKGMRLGSIGDAGAFSFNYHKIISCGDGGALVTNDRTCYERALVYHDGGASFRNFAHDLSIPVFAGLQLRANEMMAAVMRIQLQRLDGILADLRRVKQIMIEELDGVSGIRFAPSHDPKGDCGVVLPLQFDTSEVAREFTACLGSDSYLLIDSGRHVYSNWTPILEKRVGGHSAMNPFNMPQNQGLRTEYTKDMCPYTLDILSRTAVIHISPDWSESEIETRLAACRRSVEQAQRSVMQVV